MLGRHGTRGPRFDFSNNAIPKLIEYRNKITKRATLRPEDMEALKNWVTIIDTTGDKSMTQKGHDEIKDLAIRIRDAFPNLFKQQYNSENYDILSAPDSRCELSGQTFIENVFKDKTIPKIPVCDPTDILLQVDDLKLLDPKCKEIRANTEGLVKEFKEGKYMDDVVQRVAVKMGIDSTELNYEILYFMYEVATFELSIDDSVMSPWYNVFCQEDLEIFEYAHDIYRFYYNSFGDPFNAKLACPIAIRIEKRLRNKINGQGPDAVFYFGHSTNIFTLYVMLGIGDGDIPFRQSNYKGMKDLKWRTSWFGPWAANVIVVLYEDDTRKDYNVAFYLNEKLTPIKLKNDLSCTYCPWSDIHDKLTAFITDNDCVELVATNTVKNLKDSKPYWYFGTKTAYKLVSAKEIFVPPNHKPIQIFTLNRHGTTSSTQYFYNKLLPQVENLKGKITQTAKMTRLDIQAIKDWQPSIEFKPNDKDLIQKGRVEIKELALRVRNAFSDLFEQSNNYVVHSTALLQ
ncbi:multiple inositol polyphosphate phosphatase 1-like [Adelges cooleyi]|uniref:multiple inositol polyphosphate phosphatase 1-like n=1 Tax=Adelges cooleyi TaxID=133065 RepID=UPI00217F83E9|nr:multiple inositol polyphosphate phosphatase 1-like [Adelges cooleyi]